MGLFDSRADKDKHRHMLAEAGHLIAWIRSDGVPTRKIAVELWGTMWPHVNEMQEQLDDGEKHLGDAGRMHELREHIEAVSRLVAGNVAPDVRVRLRTAFFDEYVDDLLLLQDLVRRNAEEPGLLSTTFLVERLVGSLGYMEAAFRWFTEPPAPQSTKHTAEQAWAIAAAAAQSLEALRREEPR